MNSQQLELGLDLLLPQLKSQNSLYDDTFPSVHQPFFWTLISGFTFIDLFAGIGGFRIAFENLGGKCVFSSEIDKYSRKTYEANFDEVPEGDITLVSVDQIPDHDILTAGFPCQAFSIAGHRKGFEDVRGTLFFEITKIIKVKKPKAIFLENVKGLVSHNKGKTLATILDILRNDLGYFIPEPKIINAKDFGVPQNRERIFIVGFRNDLNINSFDYPNIVKSDLRFINIKEKDPVSVKYYLSEQYFNTLIAHKQRHQNKGNGFGYEIIDDDGIANAIVIGGMGKERNLVVDDRLTDFTPVTRIQGHVNYKRVRRMTPREWARLQGYPDTFKIVVSDAQAYKQFANSVAIPAIQSTGYKILEFLYYHGYLLNKNGQIMANQKIDGLINFEDLKRLYEHKKELYGANAYKYISELLREAKEVHKEVWQRERPDGIHNQSWRSFKGNNLEKLIKYIVTDEVNSLGLKIVNGSSLDAAKLPDELDKIKRNLVINYGIFGMHLPDADLVVYNPENYEDIIIISIKSTMRDRVAQTGYWKLKLKESKNTEHILVYFITLDEDKILNESKVCRKPRAIVEVDTDNCYVLTEEFIQVSNVVKSFDQLIVDLENWFSQRKSKSQVVIVDNRLES